jgi:hypothetical protein
MDRLEQAQGSGIELNPDALCTPPVLKDPCEDSVQMRCWQCVIAHHDAVRPGARTFKKPVGQADTRGLKVTGPTP